jgi:NAD(P)-dependent dehydrogenase (short-subunit alcohol dehydrogenase family)
MFIKGKTALVTGSATGIVLEYVKAFLKNGAQVSYIG